MPPVALQVALKVALQVAALMHVRRRCRTAGTEMATKYGPILACERHGRGPNTCYKHHVSGVG